MVLGEGSAVLVAGNAGTRAPYAWLSGFGVARDTTASISDWGTSAESVVTAMQGAIDDAELVAGDIDAVYVSANGSQRGDALELRALEMLFGAKMPELVKTKTVFGEYAAGGALQLVEAVRGPHQNALVNSLSAGGGIVCAVVTR
jgi:3-oxoacyl-(acyl-carrier-protein) synthase